MPIKLLRANNRVLIATGIALLLLALRAGIAATNHYPIPVDRVGGKGAAVALSCSRDVILGIALLIAALRKSKFAGATAVIVATFLIFIAALSVFTSLAFTWVHFSWRSEIIDLAFAFIILWPSLFPWNGGANRTALFLMALTFGALTLLLGSLAVLARL